MKLERNVFKSVRCSLESPQYSHFSFSVAAKSPFIWRRKIRPSTHTHLKNIITTGNSLALLCSHFPHNYYYTIKTQKTVVREVMVLYWSLWFLIRGSHSQGETFTMRPLLYDNLRKGMRIHYSAEPPWIGRTGGDGIWLKPQFQDPIHTQRPVG